MNFWEVVYQLLAGAWALIEIAGAFFGLVVLICVGGLIALIGSFAFMKGQRPWAGPTIRFIVLLFGLAMVARSIGWAMMLLGIDEVRGLWVGGVLAFMYGLWVVLQALFDSPTEEEQRRSSEDTEYDE